MVLRPTQIPSRLTEAETRLILHTISYPGFQNVAESHSTPLPAATLATLSRLHMHFLLSFPFEALSLNYEPGGRVSSDLSDIFSRFIQKRLGGGYCLQVNPLYRELLAFLRFTFIGVLARVFSPVTQDWSGFTHTTTLVYLPSHVRGDAGRGVYYMSDVGFGSSPHRPILLRHAWEEFGRGKDRFRLIKRSLQPRTSLEEQEEEEKQEVDPEVQHLASEQSVWLLQNQTPGKDWQDCYQFTTFQCFDPDYQASNKATSDRNAAPFATMILVVRYVLDPILIDESKRWVERDGLDKHLYPYHPNLVQQRMVVGDKYIVKKGEEEVEVRQIQSESERVELLKKEFGLLKHVETNEAVEEIRGKPSALNKCEKEGNKSGSQRNREW